MADLCDQAEVLEAMERAASIDAVRHAPRERQLVMDSRIVCRECEEPIPLARLASLPHVVRCADCQADHENRSRAWCL